MVGNIRKVYDYLTVKQKKIAVAELKADRLELQQEVAECIDDYPKIVREVLLHTLDSWTLEIEQLEDDIARDHGAQM
ncbi:hypothetical protein M4S82_01040 [Planococcus sp. MERTA32b]|nr:hypothetical protein [Planococcus sp. MER TA 32b]